MKELRVEEIQDVRGGVAPVIATLGRFIAGGVAYDLMKVTVRAALEGSGRVSSGGQMNRQRRVTNRHRELEKSE